MFPLSNSTLSSSSDLSTSESSLSSDLRFVASVLSLLGDWVLPLSLGGSREADLLRVVAPGFSGLLPVMTDCLCGVPVLLRQAHLINTT